MTINVTISKPNVFDAYGNLMVVGQIYGVDDDFGFALIQGQKAYDTDGSLVNPGVGLGVPANVVFLNAQAIADPSQAILDNVTGIYALDVEPYTRYVSTGTQLVVLGSGGGGGGTPGGNNGDIQYNNLGAFGGLTVGNGLVVAGGALSATGGFDLGQVLNMAALTALSVVGMASGTTVYMTGYYVARDGGEGQFWYDPTSVIAANGGTVVIPASGIGRWFRIFQNRGTFNVRWYGAKGDNATNDTAALQACITDATGYMGNSEVYFPPGKYTHDGLVVSYVAVRFRGLDSGTCQLIHRNGNFKPNVYVTGGGYASAMPYAGTSDLTMIGGDSTFPAIHYYDLQIDDGVTFDRVSYSGVGTAVTSEAILCDGLSIFDFLNMNKRIGRWDNIGGYGFRVRGDTCGATNGASTTGGTAGYRVVAAVDLVTGYFTYQSGQAIPPLGTAVMLFTSGTLPTPTTGTMLGGPEVYFMGVGTDELGMVLYRNRVDAKAGTNPITYSAPQVGTFSCSVFYPTFDMVSVDLTANSIRYLNDKNVIIATTSQDAGGKVTTYGGGYANQFFVGQAPNAGALHTVWFYSDGTLPAPLVQGTVYYPIYIDARTIKVAATAAGAVAGTAIDLTSTGTGNISIVYNHGLSRLGVGGLVVSGTTYDNVNAPVFEVINGTNTGGLGVFFIGNMQFLFKGPISFQGNRYEINKTPAVDRLYSNSRCLFRCEIGWGNRTSTSNGGPTPVALKLRDMGIEFFNGSQPSMLRLIGNSGNADLGPSVDMGYFTNIGQIYDNDNGTAVGKSPPSSSSHMIVPFWTGNNTAGTGAGLVNGTYLSGVMGIQTSPVLGSNLGTAMVKSGDLLYSDDLSVAFYQAQQPTIGASKGSGAAAGTVTGTVANGARFTLSTFSTPGLGTGSAIIIPGAGAAGADLAGIVKDLDNLSATKAFTLVDPATGKDLPCLTNVTSVAATFAPVWFSGVYPEYRVTASLNFGSIPAHDSLDLTIAAPANVTFRANGACRIGSGTPTTGVIFYPFVTSGGATVTVRACNFTAGAIDPGAITFVVFVEV